jgi:hypothetical protein
VSGGSEADATNVWLCRSHNFVNPKPIAREIKTKTQTMKTIITTTAAPTPMPTPSLEPISLVESQRLIELEKVIETGRQRFIEVGNALAEIRDARLYRVDFTSFEAYCQEKWGFTKQHAYRLIKAAPIAKRNLQVTSLNQASELAKVAAPERAAVLQAAAVKAKTDGRKLTAKDIAGAVPAATTVSIPAKPAGAIPVKPEADLYYPRAGTKKELACWYQKASNRERGEFVKSIFSKDAVEVKDKAQLKQCIDLWFETLVTEVRPGSEDVSNQSSK